MTDRPTIVVSTVIDGPRRLVRLAIAHPEGGETCIDLAPDQARRLGGQLLDAEAVGEVEGEG